MKMTDGSYKNIDLEEICNEFNEEGSDIFELDLSSEIKFHKLEVAKRLFELKQSISLEDTVITL